MTEENKDKISDDKRVIERDVTEIMKPAYINYSMNVIVARAIPDVRDGLKPVHRRILFGMKELGVPPNGATKKSARIVGNIIGKYHPHGDSAVYDAMARMAQDFNYRYPMVIGQGNFGSIDGDPPAAMRYCVTKDTLINTDKGLLFIDEIGEGNEDDEQDISLTIDSFGGKENEAIKYFNSGEHEIIEVVTRGGYTIKGSKNHPIMVITSTSDGKPNFGWKRLDQITKDDYIVINRRTDQITSQTDKVTQLEAKLLGAMVSEGYISGEGQKYHRIGFNNSNIEFADDVKNMLKELYKDIHVYEGIREYEGKKVIKEISVDGKEVYDNFTSKYDFLKGSRNKFVPRVIRESSFDNQRLFLQYLFEGDGCPVRLKENQIMVAYSSSSKRLIKEVQVMLLQFGIVSFIYSDRDKYRLHIVGLDNIKLFIDNIGFVYKDKKEKLNELYQRAFTDNPSLSKTNFIPFISKYLRSKYNHQFLHKNNFDRKSRFDKNKEVLEEVLSEEDFKLLSHLHNLDYIYLPVKEINQLDKETVYSIKVDSKCHSFTGNGFINHNTEAKLSHMADEMLRELEKDTVDMIDNYDGSEKEPAILPSRVPNLLVNGSSGIAVGMATNMPPHQLGEVVDAVVSYLDNNEISTDELMNYIQGPDFPTGGMIIGKSGIKEAYETGRGKVTVRGKVTIEEGDNGRPEVIISEIPYGISKPRLIEKIAEHVRNDKIDEIADIRDESDKEGIRIAIELRRNASPHELVGKLYKLTDLETTFGIINLAIVEGTPQILSLKEIIHLYTEHQRQVVRRRTEFDLDKAEKRAHILEGLVIVGNNVDSVVQAIRSSRNPDTAKRKLMREFKLSEVQAQAVLDLRLQRITGLEVNKTITELKEVTKNINRFRNILSDVQSIDKVIKEELLSIKEKYNDERRTLVLSSVDEQAKLGEIVKKQLVIAISHKGYVFATEEGMYARQTRGGKGSSAFKTREDDFIEHIFTCTTDQILGLFTDSGQFFKIPVTEIPEVGKNQRGTLAHNLVSMKMDDKLASYLTFHPEDNDKTLYFASSKGLIKKMSANEILNSRNGVLAIKLRSGDRLLSVFSGEDNEEFLVVSKKGQSLRFNTEDVRPMGRVAGGVSMINLAKNDEVIGIDFVKNGNFVVVLTSLGHGKRVPLTEFRLQNRGGKGARIGTFQKKHGEIVNIYTAYAKEDILLICNSGKTLRIHIKDLASMTRDTSGGKVIELNKDDFITGFAVMSHEEEE